jgi:hypothetical protein
MTAGEVVGATDTTDPTVAAAETAAAVMHVARSFTVTAALSFGLDFP